MSAAPSQLTRMRLLATGLLVTMAAIFVACRSFESRVAWLAWPAAFAEAAMVGALADWFAVVALFRKPLGFPWHTAIIPRKKDQIGDGLAKFVETNFLSSERIVARLKQFDLPSRLATWLARPENSDRVVNRVLDNVPALLEGIGDEDMQKFVRENVLDRARRLPFAPVAGRVLGVMLEGDHHLELFEQAVSLIRGLVGENRAFIREKIRRELDDLPIRLGDFDPLQGAKEGISNSASRWVVDRIQSALDEVHEDRNHRLRAQFDSKTKKFLRDLRESPAMEQKANDLRDRFLQNRSLHRALDSLWQSIKGEILAECRQPDSIVRKRLADTVQSLGQNLLADAAFRAKLDQWLTEGVSSLLDRHGHEIGDMIRETIHGWDGDEVAAKIERQVGSDLQFIRINGTIVGGLVGLGLYAVTKLFWS